jgi:hypothetical protein
VAVLAMKYNPVLYRTERDEGGGPQLSFSTLLKFGEVFGFAKVISHATVY